MKRTLLLVTPAVAALVLSAVVPATAKPKPPSDKGQAPGVIAFVGAPYAVDEAAGTVTITVERFTSVGEATGKGRAAVDIITSDGTATTDSDFTAVSATLTFAKDETQASVAIPILDDSAVEGNETFTVTLSNPVGRYNVPDPTVAITISDDDTVAGPITNGGFETGDFTSWFAGAMSLEEPVSIGPLAAPEPPDGRSTTAPPTSNTAVQALSVTPPTPVVQGGTVHDGSFAAYLGGPVEGMTPLGASYLYQDVTVPDDGHSVLSFYYHPENANAELAVQICDGTAPAGDIVSECFDGMALSWSPETWQEHQVNLGAYVGQTVRIVFLVAQWGEEGGASMYLDDVTLLMAGPANLLATPVTPPTPPYEIDLSWDTAADATGYQVLRSTSSGGPYTPLDTTTTTSYQDTSVAPATFYCYVVRTITDEGETANSNESCAEVVAEQVFNGGFESGDFTGWTAGIRTEPEGPGLMATTSTSVAPPVPVVQDTTVHSGTYAATLGGLVDGQIPTGQSFLYTDVVVPAAGAVVSFHYRPASDADQILHVDVCDAIPPAAEPWFYCAGGGPLPYADIDTWHQGLIEITGEHPYVGRTVRLVFTVEQNGYLGGLMHLDDVTLEEPITMPTPLAPTNVAAVADSAFQVSLSWDAATGANGYRVYRSTTSAGPYESIGATDATTFVDRSVGPDTTYYYVVHSVFMYVFGSGMESPDSAEASATTASAVVTMLDTLEGDTSGWATTGMVGDQTQSLWHLIDDSACTTPAYASATHAFYYGIDDPTCSYDTIIDVGGYPQGVRNSGTLTSPDYTIPETAEVLGFAYLLDTECDAAADPFCRWDRATVEVSYDSGATWSLAAPAMPRSSGGWALAYLPISPTGTTLQVRFAFDTIDGDINDFLGWMVDDLSVYTSGATSGTFQNAGTIWIPAAGPANPYPSTITVSGLVGTVTDVNVTLSGFTHSAPGDVDVLLVGPTGQTVVLFGRAGGAADIAGVNLTFDDSASGCLPQSPQIVSGTYRPCPSYGTTVFGPPAPSSPYGTTLGGFAGTEPNGSWSLYVFDVFAGDYGQFSGGWSLTITTS